LIFTRSSDELGHKMAMLTMLKHMKRTDLTVHGFRSTFRDWAAERTDYPAEMAEIALAHTVGSAVDNAYRQSDLFARRRKLMQDWAAWCAKISDSKPSTDPVLAHKARFDDCLRDLGIEVAPEQDHLELAADGADQDLGD
jgi:hypothetical protein